MTWKILKASNTRYEIQGEDGRLVGDIADRGSLGGRWYVRLLMVKGFDKSWPMEREAFAYVRGVEAAVQVYGREMAS